MSAKPAANKVPAGAVTATVSSILQRLEQVAASGAADRLLFNGLTGRLAEYVAAARRRHRYRGYRERYDVHPDFEFNGPGIVLYGRGEISLGPDSYVGTGSRLQAKAGNAVRVGRNTAVGHYVFCYTQNRVADQDMSLARNRNRSLAVREGDVTVGAHCWVGAFTFLTEGSSVGENTVVGASSVVTGDLPPHAVCAGAPARVREFKSHLPAERRDALAREYEPVLAPAVREEYLGVEG